MELQQIFTEVPNIEFHRNPSSGTHADTCEWTDMMKVVGTLCDYANVPKNKAAILSVSQKECIDQILK